METKMDTQEKTRVYRIVHFQERFKPEGTEYVRIPIIPLNDAQVDYLEADKNLQLEPEHSRLYGCLLVLLRKAAGVVGDLQGHLLDESGQPATVFVISSWLHTDLGQAEKVLLKLQHAGLIEQALLPSGKL